MTEKTKKAKQPRQKEPKPNTQKLKEQKPASNASFLSPQELSNFFNLTGLMLGIAGTDGYFKHVNPAWENTLGYSPEELVSNPWISFVHPDDIQTTIAQGDKLIGGASVLNFKNRYRCKDGTYKWMQWTVHPVNDLLYCYVQDVTEAKKAEESLKRFKFMSDNATEAFLLMRQDGTFAYLNDVALERWGYTKDEISDIRVPDIDPIYDDEEYEELFNLAQKEKIPLFETVHRHKDGTIFPVEISTGGITLNGKPYLFAVARDITERKLYEDELKESEMRFRNLADTAPMYMAMADETGNAVYFNKPWLEFTGRTIEQMQGLQWLEVLHPEDALKFERDFKEAFSKQIPINQEYRFRRADGEYRWMLAVGAPRLTPEGRFIGYFGTYTDFHELKQAQIAVQESEEKFRTLADNIPNLAWMANADGWITWYNSRWYEYTGTTPEQMEGWGWQAVHDPKLLPQIMEQWLKSIETGQPFEMVLPLKGADKQFRQFLTRIKPVRGSDGNIVHWIGTNTDITRQKELERQKDDFIGIASHELKTPVTSIKAYAQLLQRQAVKKGDTNAADKLKKMDSQLNKLTSLIGDLLDVTKIESGKLQFHNETFDFDELVRDTVETMALTSPRHTIQIKGKAKQTIEGDRQRISQVLVNLISNAIKYSPHSEEILVTASSDKQNVKICVRDYGLGISTEKQEKVFERFFRVSGPHMDSFPGLGLGLYISAEIIRKLKGRIWVESTKGKGSTFCFSLPIESKAEHTKPDITSKEEIKHD